jgi:hypothetical protein
MARVAGGREEAAFSSLSRDNLAPQEVGPGRGCTDFQLPLSGSLRRGNTKQIWRTSYTFNSLSRDHEILGGEREIAAEAITFNSLSRDHLRRHFPHGDVRPFHFQLPLSGSRSHNKAGSDSGANSVAFHFQLPLSGSPSPIPGFSGSPRLSAAAPLRTNDF